MSTDAQIAANRINAQASCGPRTAEGRARVALNAVSTGLYSSGDFIRPGEQDLYAQFCAGFRTELALEGAIEETLAAEIIHAAWRMRRCSVIEAAMMPAQADEGADAELDPMLDRAQQSVDRARAAAHRIFHRAIAELRRVQTERRLPFVGDYRTFLISPVFDQGGLLSVFAAIGALSRITPAAITT